MSRLVPLVVLLLLAAGVLAVAPFVGQERIPVSALWDRNGGTNSLILWQLRLPRVAIAFLAGASLAVGGMTFQAVFRNPLATPFTLGVASGASLGAAIYIHLKLSLVLLGIPGISVFAFLGAAAAILVVYGLARLKRGFSSATMLLAGVAVSFFFSSLILLLQYLGDFTQAYRILRWVMGGLDLGLGFGDAVGMLPLILAGTLIVVYHTHELNLLSIGEELAASRGVEVQRTKAAIFFAASLLVGAVVAVCGPIGFVGLMAPHICRLVVGADHRILAPATWLFGGAFLTTCDTAARTMLAPVELPVGILTAMLGGPFFLYLLLTRSVDEE